MNNLLYVDVKLYFHQDILYHQLIIFLLHLPFFHNLNIKIIKYLINLFRYTNKSMNKEFIGMCKSYKNLEII